ncbi:MAG: FAD-dependent oxidoreductase [Actinobacteria bacterium]|nr:FAD-dependent oxidoreductase [Actinomycetota bacterium]
MARIDADVVVVGAGFAGLAAALALQDAGASTVVVEARARVGGRVWSLELENGSLAELGGEWIMPDDEVVPEISARLGLELAEAGVDYLRREPRGEGAVSLEALDSFLRSADAFLAGHDVPDAPLGELLEAVPGDDRARAVVRSRLQGTFATDLSLVAWRSGWHAGRLAADPAVYRRVVSGNQSIARAAADALPDVRLDRTVTGIEQAGGAVAVRSGDEAFRAAAAVVAVPAPIAAGLAFDPPLDPGQRTALEELPMGVASKLAVPLVGEPERCAVQCANAPFWFWVGDGGDGRTRPVVTSFAGSELAQEVLATASGDPGTWIRRIGSLAPELRFGGPARMQVWANDPFARGAYSAWDPRSAARADMFARPHGAIAFAGEHTAGDHAGTMEGALRSGLRAAGQTLERLGVDRPIV